MLKSLSGLGAVAVTLASVQLAGCGLLFNNDLIGGEDAYIRDRGQDYEKSQQSNLLVVPPHLDSDKVDDLLVVPDIGTAAIQSEQEFKIPRPDFFTAEAGNDKVNLARDGQERLILVNEPQEQVWIKLQGFWSANNQSIAIADPQQGLIETAWIESDEERPGLIARMVAKLTFSEIEGPAQDKLRAYVKPVAGDRSKTSIRLQHLRAAVSDQSAPAEWSSDGQNVHYKSQVMYEILRYLSQSTVESTASAARKREQKQGRVFFGRGSKGEPVLKLTVSVDQAWEHLNQALQQAQVDVGSSNRQLGRYYITYTSVTPLEQSPEFGFFEWLHGDREEIKINTDVLTSALGIETDSADQGPKYSSKKPDDNAEQKTEQQKMVESDGYKIWLGDKVVYVFGSEQDDNSIKVDAESGTVEYTGRYQIKISRRSSGVYVSILTEDAQPAPPSVAEDILWTLKENMPAG